MDPRSSDQVAGPDRGIPAQVIGYSIGMDGSLTDLRTITNWEDGPTSLLYLIEGTIDSAAKRFIKDCLPGIPDAFFDVHLADTLSRIEHDIDSYPMLIAKWSRVANQTIVAWLREKQLREGNPFDVHHQDPVASRLDHEKLVHASQPYRPYDPIFEYIEKRRTGAENCQASEALGETADEEAEERAAQDDPESRPRHRPRLTRAAFTGLDMTPTEPAFRDLPLIRHAVRDSISVYHGRHSKSSREVAVILFDPIHRRQRISVKYNLWVGGDPSKEVTNENCFENEEATLPRFVRMIEESLANWPFLLGHIVDWAVISLVLADQARLMGAIGRALDEMELAMASKTYERWRNYAPAWRNHLYHQLDTLTHFADELKYTGPESDAILLRVQAARARMEALSRRLDSSFQTLTSTMSIIESEKAIQEAEEVTRLTNLAFFFIPLSLVASVFGMNVIEFDQRLTSWMWVAASLLITILTYSIRFRRPLSRIIMSTPGAVRTLRWDVAFVMTRRVVQFARPWAKWVFYLGSLIGFEVSLWFVAQHPSLTPDARIGIGTALGALPPTYYALVRKGLKYFTEHKKIPQLMFFFLAVVAVGVALWKLATRPAFETNEKIGVALGIFGVQFFVGGICSIPIILISILNCPNGEAFYPGVVKQVIPRTLQAIMRLTLLTVHGVVLWKLFTSPVVAESAKICVAIGVAIVTTIVGFRFFSDPQKYPWPFRERHRVWTKIFADLVATDLFFMSVAGAVSPAVWKLATSQLSDGTKVAIGIGAICTPLGYFLLSLQWD